LAAQLIDLHTHTTFSDGTLTPSELVAYAHQKGLAAIAVTDHDTVDGLAEAQQAGRELGLEIIPALEISAEYAPGTMHILGYYIAAQSQMLVDRLSYLRQARSQRNPLIAEKLQRLGFDISYQEVAAIGGQVVGRPHFARAMMEKGYVNSIQEAFDLYLKKGRPAYVEKERLAPDEAIKLIVDSGGVAVLAHPYQLKLETRNQNRQILAELKQLGLGGVEAIYSRHSSEQTEMYLELCEELDLVATGGSDFHGENKPDIDLGTGKGDLAVPYRILEQLRQRRQ